MARRFQSPARRWSPAATLALIALAVLFAYPFLWMLPAAFKTNPEIFNPRVFWPANWNTEPTRQLIAGEWFPFWRVLLNSLLVAFGQAALATLLSALAGYAFANLRGSASRLLFFVALIIIVIPIQSIAVAVFVWVNKLGLTDRLWGLILPGAVSGLGIVWFTQIFRQVPVPLREAARLDGANEWRVWWTLMPMLLPAAISFGMIQFVLAWHEHLMAMLILHSGAQQTLPVALSSLYGSSLRFPYAALMAGSLVSLLPIAILFGLCFRRFKSALADVIMH